MSNLRFLFIFCVFIGGFNPHDCIPVYQPYRTAYHFQPLQNWMNDPTGPMLHNGVYHLFYQYNPYDTKWGPPVWAHSTSVDLVNWVHQPVAIGPQTEVNQGGSWSGSATLLPGNKPVIFFTGVTPKGIQVQNLAFPKNILDPELKEWNLSSQNPVIFPSSDRHINSTAFRDPSTGWFLSDGKWRVVVGNLWDRRGIALLFKSENFLQWDLAPHPLYSVKDTGMWECPDFFPVFINGSILGVDTSSFGVGVKHVLKISLDDFKHDVYSIGTYNISEDSYVPDPGFHDISRLRYDYGNFYASKTFYDSALKRRVLLGWVNESSTEKADSKKGWAGIHAIPRRIWFDRVANQLIQWPVSDIEHLRENVVTISDKVIKQGSMFQISGVTAAQADVLIRFKVIDLKKAENFEECWTDPQWLCSQRGASARGQFGPFGLLALASKGLEEHTAVFFRVFRTFDERFVVLMCCDRGRSSLNPGPDKFSYGTFLNVSPVHEEISLRVLIDHSVLEAFGGRGRSVITARVYPLLAVFEDAQLYVFNNGTRDVQMAGVQAWSMKNARIG